MYDISTVLLVSRDFDEWRPAVNKLVEEHEYRVLRVEKGHQAISLCREINVDLVLCEEDLQDAKGIDVLRQFRIIHPYVIRILVKNEASCNADTDATGQASIYQYIRKPLDCEEIILLVKRALESRELARRHRLLSRELKFSEDSLLSCSENSVEWCAQFQKFEKLIYVSEAMSALCGLARQAAPTDLPVLIEGETGTGKELLAHAIHYNSGRSANPLMVQNCGGMQDELLQSELFGHRRGAFTGAVGDRLGLFRAANGGTVFLDEISDVSASFQISLLRFLQEGEVKPLGSDKVLTSNVRIIAASNKPLKQLVEQNKFRQDLYFRLKGIELNIPPLRKRTEDIPVLAQFFARNYGQSIGRRVLGIAQEVLTRLKHYSFPGNVRELENEIKRMVALAQDGSYLLAKHLSPDIVNAAPSEKKNEMTRQNLSGDTLRQKVESLEKHLVVEALIRNRWNQSETSRELGLSRVGLANKIKRYKIDYPALMH